MNEGSSVAAQIVQSADLVPECNHREDSSHHEGGPQRMTSLLIIEIRFIARNINSRTILACKGPKRLPAAGAGIFSQKAIP
jgi:hypothetical protein